MGRWIITVVFVLAIAGGWLQQSSLSSRRSSSGPELDSISQELKLAKRLAADAMTSEAILIYQRLQTMDAGLANMRTIRNNLGLIHALRGDYREALELLAKNRREFPDQSLAHMNYAVLALFDGKAEDSLVAMDQALALQPDNLVVRRNAAIAHLAAGNQELALWHYRVVAQGRPEDLNDQLVYSCLLLQTGRFENANRIAGSILERETANEVARRIQSLARENRPEVYTDRIKPPRLLPPPAPREILIAMIE